MAFDLDILKSTMYPVIGAIYEVHKELGPGLNEYGYQEGLAMQLAEDCIGLEKEKEFKKVKKTEYFNTLKDLFSMFFQNKYLIEDTDNGFIVKLENNIINDKLNDVLSDGEKSIMAFCNYIAETHIIVNNKKTHLSY